MRLNAICRRARRDSGSTPRRARVKKRLNALAEPKPTRAPIAPIGSRVCRRSASPIRARVRSAWNVSAS
ncbi:hypothetical protein AQ950_01075 [Burkholderia pseudomallei]|nr:hypothetical protein ACT79_19060 [Burkholderia pseudomallei]OMR40720.1 hypothetical protein AQ723_10860 [Burkholderia pseudomallei]OMT29788.1 hypothetical protein AQ756_09585 [Burkholderia pseudomallei]OMU86170.1 hypothetical protein AQ783_04245 [Burkholderia pseudomallei]OND88451.1 hypothetical protein AQ941_29725 [Burkholderia pseudomallei]